MGDVHEVLRRFSLKQASVEESMRALVSYDGWYAPGAWAADVFKTNTFENACIWGTESTMPPGKLWLFTTVDAGHAAVARGANPGFYVGPLRGSTVFENLPSGLAEVVVNPGSAPEMGWFMGGSAVKLGNAWGRAIALERALEAGDDFAQKLAAFPEFLLLVHANGGIVTAVGAAGMKNPGLIFSAPDCREAGRVKLGPGAAALRDGGAVGATLFKELSQIGVDGYILNVGGIGPTRVFTREACTAIVELAASMAEADRLEAVAKALAEGT